MKNDVFQPQGLVVKVFMSFKVLKLNLLACLLGVWVQAPRPEGLPPQGARRYVCKAPFGVGVVHVPAVCSCNEPPQEHPS